MAGLVSVNGRKIEKPGTPVAEADKIAVRETDSYVSRGGLKLEKAFAVFGLDVSGKVALDAGASTGGFTDCLLKQGARKVIAVDVGYGQLDWSLRQNPQVEVLERTNIRHIDASMLSEAPELATLDLSFISLKKVLPAVIECFRPGFEIVALVKPQFEAGKNKVGKGGVVRDADVRRQVLSGIWDFAEKCGCNVQGLTESGLKGPKGNIEYLMYLVDKRILGKLPLPDKESTLENLF